MIITQKLLHVFPGKAVLAIRCSLQQRDAEAFSEKVRCIYNPFITFWVFPGVSYQLNLIQFGLFI